MTPGDLTVTGNGAFTPLADMNSRPEESSNPYNVTVMGNFIVALGNYRIPVDPIEYITLWLRPLDISNLTYTAQICNTTGPFCDTAAPSSVSGFIPPPTNATFVSPLNSSNSINTSCYYVVTCRTQVLPLKFSISSFKRIDDILNLDLRIVVTQLAVAGSRGLYLDGWTIAKGREIWFLNYEATDIHIVQEILPFNLGFDDIRGLAVFDGDACFFGKLLGETYYTFYRATPTSLTAIPGTLAMGIRTVVQNFQAILGPIDDDCGLCNGNNVLMNPCGTCYPLTCSIDCFGVPSGNGIRDACFDCRHGTSDPLWNSECNDCAGVPGGPHVFDGCGNCLIPSHICFNQTCIDCKGNVNGTSRYDECGVCDGDGSKCIDCLGRIIYANVTNHTTVINYNTPFYNSRCNLVPVPLTTTVCTATIPLYTCDSVAAFTPPADLITMGCLFPNGTYLGSRMVTKPAGCQTIPLLNDGVQAFGSKYVCPSLNSSDVCSRPYPLLTIPFTFPRRENATYKAVIDRCGVCNGAETCARDCFGTPNGIAVNDSCGYCVRPDSPLFNRRCKDCAGSIGGLRIRDACGACLLSNSSLFNLSCAGCDGIPNSNKKLDICYVCGGNNGSCIDCDGVLRGNSRVDLCGICRPYGSPLYNVGCNDCFGVPGGNRVIDACGVCGGNNNTCVDCADVPYGTHVSDACGKCFPTETSLGFNESCRGCDGIINSGKVNDSCGVCGGLDMSCKDCLGETLGTAVFDVCGMCNGTNTTCTDCLGELFGPARIDECGFCFPNTSSLGFNDSCRGCDGVPNSGKEIDACEKCGGDNSTCFDCRGTPNGTYVLDDCNPSGCWYSRENVMFNFACTDCLGDVNGNATLDQCNVCLYIDSPIRNRLCAGCDNVPNSGLVYDSCGVCNGTNSTCIGCDNVPYSGLTIDHCGVCGGTDNSCLGSYCYVDSHHPLVDVPGSLRYSSLNKALSQCWNHVGVKIVDSVCPVTGPLRAFVDNGATYTIESNTPSPVSIYSSDNIISSSFSSIVLHNLAFAYAVPSTKPLLTINTCGCISTDTVAFSGQYFTSAVSAYGVRLNTSCDSLPTCENRLVNTQFEKFNGPNVNALQAIYESALHIDGVTCTNIGSRCIHITGVQTYLDINNIVGTQCGNGVGSCIDVYGTNSVRIPDVTLLSNIQVVSPYSSTTLVPAIRLGGFSLAALTAYTLMSGTSTPRNTFSSGLVLTDIGAIDNMSTDAKLEFLRILWLKNRNIDSFQSLRDVRYIGTGGDVSCSDGCSVPSTMTFFHDAAHTIAMTYPSSDFYGPSDIVFLHTSIPLPFNVRPLQLVACSTDSLTTYSAYSPITPNSGCFSPSVPPARRVVIYDHIAGPALSSTFTVLANTVSFSFPANPLFASNKNVLFQFVYDVIDPINGRMYTVAPLLAPVDLVNTHNPSSSSSAYMILRCPAGLVVTSFNPVVCATYTVLPTPTGQTVVSTPGFSSNNPNIQSAYSIILIAAIVVVCGIVFLMLMIRRRNRTVDTVVERQRLLHPRRMENTYGLSLLYRRNANMIPQ